MADLMIFSRSRIIIATIDRMRQRSLVAIVLREIILSRTGDIELEICGKQVPSTVFQRIMYRA